MKITKRGYVLIYKPKHPFCNANGWVFQHRLKMEEYMDRYLTKEERVHHINGDKTNNFIGNLILFSNHSEHLKYELSKPKAKERLRMYGYLRVQSDKTKEKCRIAKLGNKHCVGRKYSEKTLQKMRESQHQRREMERYATAY